MLALHSFAQHMTDEGNQLQLGLQHAGYRLWGKGYPGSSCQDAPKILVNHRPSTLIVQDKREWDGSQAGCLDTDARFSGTFWLPEDSSAFRLTITKDAHQNPPYSRHASQEIGCHAWIAYYHPNIVHHLAPWTRREHIIRTYHSVNPADVPAYSLSAGANRRTCIFTGAVNRHYYPLRWRLWMERHRLTRSGIDFITHPGYHARGSNTPEYLKKLSGFKVSICTSSIFGYSLRKIIESTACGCVVVTDLPVDDVLPEIDGNLVRLRPDVPIDDLLGAVLHAAEKYDPERQAAYSRAAVAYYDYRVAGQRLARNIEAMRLSYPTTAPAGRMKELELVASDVFTIPSSLQSRDEFGDLLNRMGLTGVAAEIGVHRGEFADTILSRWTGEKLLCIDPWQDGLEGYDDLIRGERQPDFEETRWRLSKYGERVELVRKLSVDAAKDVADGSLDFVYIDANHKREFVEADILAWWPKVKSGGILAGHDLNNDWECEVKPAVFEWCKQTGLKVSVVPGPMESWFFRKP